MRSHTAWDWLIEASPRHAAWDPSIPRPQVHAWVPSLTHMWPPCWPIAYWHAPTCDTPSTMRPSIPHTCIWGVARVTCHLPHVAQLIRPLILPNCKKADHQCTSRKQTGYIPKNYFPIYLIWQYSKFGDYSCPASGAGQGAGASATLIALPNNQFFVKFKIDNILNLGTTVVQAGARQGAGA